MAWQPPAGPNDYDVIIVGAGIAGVNFAYRLQERCPHLKYTILERRSEVGGTWSLFKYPGIRSDSDLFTFGFSWRPWMARKAIAKGELIQQYVAESAHTYGIDTKIKFGHTVSAAAYTSASRTWNLTVDADGQTQTFRGRFMLLCTGYYDYLNPLKASIPGIEKFGGTVVHPQFWPADLDYTDKNVVVIGSGATAVTILPVMAKKASHVTMLQRSPSYVVSVQSEDWFEWLVRFLFAWSPSIQHAIFRTKWIMASMLITTLSKYFPRLTQSIVHKRTDALLPASCPRDPHFSPRYYPWEQRMCLCPDGDFFEGLRSGKSSVETGIISDITRDTIRLASGKELHPDIIVTATGLQLQFGGGMALSIDGQPYSIPPHYVWKGLMLEDLPNAAFVFGYVDASWTLGADATAQLVCRMLNRMKRENVVEVRPYRSEREKKEMQPLGFVRLNSTYVERSRAVTPKAGDRGQWVARSYYLKDMWNAWFGDIKTSVHWVKAGQ